MVSVQTNIGMKSHKKPDGLTTTNLSLSIYHGKVI